MGREMNFVDYLARVADAGTDWRQHGADYAVSVLDAGGSPAEALQAAAGLLAAGGMKLSLPLRGADGGILASKHVDIDRFAAAEVSLGIVWAVAWRQGYATARRDPEVTRARIGFH